MITESPQFFTATILEWKKSLKPGKYKDIIISSLQFLVENNRVKVCSLSEDYKYSSVWLDETGVNDWTFVTHYAE